MSWSPQEWKSIVLEHYGSIAAFNDRGTVEIMRQRIAEGRATNKLILDAHITHPGAVGADTMTRVRAEETELSGLDAELADWLEKNPRTAPATT